MIVDHRLVAKPAARRARGHRQGLDGLVVEVELALEMADAIGMSGVEEPPVDRDPHPLPGDPLEEEGVGSALEDLRFQLRLVEVEQPLEHRQGDGAPMAAKG